MKKVLILVGIPGSGKSYFTNNYIKQYGGEYVICSADHHFEDLAAKHRAELEAAGDPEAANAPSYKFDFMQLRTAHMNCQQKYLQALQREVPLVIVDNTNITKKERHFYVQEGIKHGYEVEIKAFPKDENTIKLAASRNLHGVPAEKIAQRAMSQDLDAGMYKVGLDPADILGKRYVTTPVVEAFKFIKKELIKENCFDEISSDLAAVKEKITQTKTEYPEDKDPDIAEALDDMTGAIDVASHHIDDIKGKLSEDPEKPDKEQALKVVFK
jgi:GTPase SAR1 family protein